MGATEGFMRAEIKKLEEEIKKLKTDLGTVIDERDNAFKKIKQLEERLDNKEKVNKSLRKDIKWYEKEEDRLREENRQLKHRNEILDLSLKASVHPLVYNELVGSTEISK